MAITSITEAPKMFGAYVSNISSSIGWGGQGGSCQMTLVEDPDNGVVVTLPEVGTACYFRFEKFYFGGIFQRYTYKESTSGRTYDITLESPAKVLDGLQVILGGFEGTAFNIGSGYDSFEPYKNPTFTNELNNIYNPFGHEENWTVGHLRDPARNSHFGKADTNSVGFPAVRLLELIELISQGPDEDGIVASEFGGKAKFGESEYTIDLTELIDILKTEIPKFRVGGNVKNLNGILADCTDIIQYDYFMSVTGDEPTATTENADGSQTFNTRQFRPSTTVDGRTIAGGIEGTVNGGGVLENPILTIKTVSRAEQPEPNWIKNQIASYKDDMLVSSETGKELSDTVTQKLVIGGDASRYYTAPSSTFLPIWGKNSDTDGYHVEYSSAELVYRDPYHKVRIHNIPVGTQAPQYLAGSAWATQLQAYYATIFELRMALSGWDTWVTYKYLQILKESNDWRNMPFQVFSGDYATAIRNIVTGKWGLVTAIMSSPIEAWNRYGFERTDEDGDFGAKFVFDQVVDVATRFWGRMFLVPLPREPGGLKNNFRWISDEGKGNAEMAWDIVDSAWAQPAPIDDISFYDGSGRLKTTATWKYDGMKQDYSVLGAEWALTANTATNQIASTKAQIEKDIYWVTDLSGETQPYAVCTCPQILEWDNETTQPDRLNNFACIINHLWPPVYPSDAVTRSTLPHIAIGYKPVIPAFFGIPQQSNRYKWGPWYKYGALNGKAEVVNDESLKPETFGKQSLMDEAGFAIAYAGIARMTASETGYVELAEYPAFSIAERFGDAGPYVTNLDISIGTGGVKTTYKFNTWTPNFGRLAKYNIDRISRINKANLSFDQQQRKLWQRTIHRRPEPFGVAVNGQEFGVGVGAGAWACYLRTYGNYHPEGGMLSLTEMVNLSVEKYKESYGNTHDQILSHINIDKNPGDETTKPCFEKPVPFDGVENPFALFGDGKFTGPTQNELNPYFSTVTGEKEHFIANVDFTSVIHGDNAEEIEDITLRKMSDGDRRAIKTVRPAGLRGPLMLSGWGFDIADRPVPSQGEEGNEPFIFDINTPKDRRLWKSGPVNLMWDDERKVWAGGLQMVCGVLTGGDIIAPTDPKTPTSFKVKVLRKKEREKGKAFADLKEVIACYNYDPSLDQSLVLKNSDQEEDWDTNPSMVWVMAVRINYEWIPYWVGCPTPPST